MWFTFKIYIRDRFILPSLITAVGFQVAEWLYLFTHISPRSESVFLHYTILSGIDLIGPAWQAYTLPAAGFLMIIINGVIGFLTFNQGRFVARLLGVATIFLQIMLLMAAVFIVSLNT